MIKNVITIELLSKPPLSPKEISEVMNDLFVGKPDTERVRHEIKEFKKHWVQRILHSEYVEEVLSHYINLFQN